MLCRRSENVAAPLPKRDAWVLRKWNWDIYEIELWELAKGRYSIIQQSQIFQQYSIPILNFKGVL